MAKTGATGHPTGQEGGEQRRGPPSPPSPPRPPPQPAGRGGAGPPPLPGPGGRPPSPRRDRDARGGTQLDPHATRPCAPTRLHPQGWRPAGEPAPATRTTHGPRPGAARDDEPEQYGGRAPDYQSIANDARNFARSGRAEGRAGSIGASGGGGSRAAPPPPPPPGWSASGRTHPVHGAAPRPRPNAYARGECAGNKRGAG